MKISIVIPAFNEEKLLGGTLQSVWEAAKVFPERGWEWELIVCDNNSTDRTAEIARAAGAKVVFEQINQIARARNAGAAAATGEWLLFVDADSRVNRELLKDAAAAIESGRVLAGGATIRLDGSSKVGGFVTRLWNTISRTGKWLAGSFIFCEASAFREVGGFNTNLYASEELALTKRLKVVARNRGRKLVVLHKHPLVTSARKMHLYSGREHLWFLAKTVFSWGGTVKSAETCHIWYDGRR